MKIDKKMQGLAASLALCLTSRMFPGDAGADAEFGENRILMIPSRDSKDLFGVSYVYARLEGGIGPDGLTTDSACNVHAAHYGAGEIAVFDRHGFPYGTIPLPHDAGPGSTNMAFKDGYLYVKESLKNEVWHVHLNHAQPGIHS